MMTALEQYEYFIDELIELGKLVEVEYFSNKNVRYHVFNTEKFKDSFFIGELTSEEIGYLHYLNTKYKEDDNQKE
jgi:hypothetical protein